MDKTVALRPAPTLVLPGDTAMSVNFNEAE